MPPPSHMCRDSRLLRETSDQLYRWRIASALRLRASTRDFITDIRKRVKPIAFLGGSLDDLRGFPADARRQAGHQLDRVQRGLDPDDWRPMQSIGSGVREIRVREAAGVFRVIYVAAFADAIYVLHAF